MLAGEPSQPAATAPGRSRGDERTRCSPNEGARGAWGARTGPFFGILDRHLVRQCLSFFSLVLIAVIAIYVVISLSERVDEIQRNAVSGTVVVSYYFFQLPQILMDIVPLAFLIAFLGTAAVLERHNETTALRASGISLTRASAPLLGVAALLALALFAMNESVVQRSNRTSQRLEDIIKGRKVARSYRATDRPWMFLPDGRTLVNFLQYDADSGSLLKPSIYVFDADLNLLSLYMARQATFTAGRWVAEAAWSRVPGPDGTADFIQHAAPVALPLDVPPTYFGREYRSPSQMSFAELRSYISTLRAAGYRADKLVVQLHYKLAYPLSLVVLAWLALPYAFRMGRRGTIMGVAVALVLGMAYFAVTAFVTKMGEASLLPPALAAWTPTVVFALLAMNRHTTLRT